MEEKNKIQYGLSNVRYAKVINETDGAIEYDTPKRIPGAVTFTMDPQQENMRFDADNTNYFSTFVNNGYSGTLTMAIITDEFKIDCLGFEEIDGVVLEKGNALSTPFALMWQFEGDKHGVRYVSYYNTAGRPTVAGQTKGSTIEPGTQEMQIEAQARPTDDWVKTNTNENTTPEVYNSWFDKVHEPTEVGGV